LENKKKNIHDGALLLSGLSLICLSIHLSNAHDLGLMKKLDLMLEELSKRLNSLQCEIDWTAHQNIRIFCEYLNKAGKGGIAQELWGVVDGKSEGYGSINRLNLFNHIKRPIVTFDSNLFARFDEEIFGQNFENRSVFEA
jgi:hypothetical protein